MLVLIKLIKKYHRVLYYTASFGNNPLSEDQLIVTDFWPKNIEVSDQLRYVYNSQLSQSGKLCICYISQLISQLQVQRFRNCHPDLFKQNEHIAESKVITDPKCNLDSLYSTNQL